MSVESEILRIQHNIADTYATVSSKGGDVPLQPNSENLAAAVASIPAGDSAVLVKSPVGTIVIWSGTVDNIPVGWQLCDGTNGTPDLRDKFVLGAGTSHAVGDSGGSEEVTLTAAQMPSHRHDISSAGSPNSSYGVTRVDALTQVLSGVNIATSETGSSQPHPNMPPYYALCYIMKLTADETDAPDISVDETLTKSPTNELSVTTPVKTFVTQDEYDALSEEERSKGLYGIVGGVKVQTYWFSPKMTSNTTPQPYVASASSIVGINAPYRAFRNDEETMNHFWHSDNIANSWIQLDFGLPTIVKGVKMLPSLDHSNTWNDCFPKSFTVSGSNDGATFVDIYAFAPSANDTYDPTTDKYRITKFQNEFAYRYWRITSHSNYAGNNYAIIQNIQFSIPKASNSGNVNTALVGMSINGEFIDVLPGGGTIDQVNSAIDTKLDAYEPQEVYSTEETRIGTWVDGKPLYRKVLNTTFPDSNGQKALWNLGFIPDTAIRCYGTVKRIDNGHEFLPITAGLSRNGETYLYQIASYVYIYVSLTDTKWLNVLKNQPCCIVLEYTKTTDQAQTAFANTVLKASSKAPALNSIQSVAVTASGAEEIEI